MIPPSDRVPEQGPDWFLVTTEACGGRTPDLRFFLGVYGFIGIFGVTLVILQLRFLPFALLSVASAHGSDCQRTSKGYKGVPLL